MSTTTATPSSHRARWAAIGAAIAVSVGAGGIGLANATSPDGASTLVPIEPCRIADTRPAQQTGVKNTAFGPNETHVVATRGGVTGRCEPFPSGISGLALNVTAVGASELTHLTFWASGPVPNSSSLNPAPGQPPTPNAVTVEVADDGSFRVFNFAGNVHLIIDVLGYYTDHHHDDRYFTKGQVNQLIDGVDTTPGPVGPPGPRGLSAWDVIPSGVTVTGQFVNDSSATGATASDRYSVDLPGIAPTPLTHTTVNFAADNSNATVDDDPTCTGSVAVPTAPPGKVCLYLSSSFGVSNLQGQAGVLPARGFVVWFTPTGAVGGDMWVVATWAYTAP